jgi:putative Holliday junction resolvase
VRVLGVDYGSVRIGLALSDSLGMIARALPCVQAANRKQAVARIAAICRENAVTEVVVGLPLHANGSEGEASKGARALGGEIAAATGLPLEYLDERLTTKLADRVLLEADLSRKKRKALVDSLAATVLLQNYLDAKAEAEGGSNASPHFPC